jgi:hypothetical protein
MRIIYFSVAKLFIIFISALCVSRCGLFYAQQKKRHSNLQTAASMHVLQRLFIIYLLGYFSQAIDFAFSFNSLPLTENRKT